MPLSPFRTLSVFEHLDSSPSPVIESIENDIDHTSKGRMGWNLAWVFHVFPLKSQRFLVKSM